VNEFIIHTGQHFDNNISSLFFKELKIPKHNYNLNIGGESNTKITAKIMLKLERILNKEIPRLFGDGNSASSIARQKIKLANNK